MTGPLQHPALQAAAGVGALLALTWPLLVFDRPVYVVCSFFIIWPALIGLLFAFSRVPEHTRGDGLSDVPPGQE